MNKCANINSDVFKEIEKQYTKKDNNGNIIRDGRKIAWTIFMLNNQELPDSLLEVNDLYDRYYKKLSPFERVKRVLNYVELEDRSNMVLEMFYDVAEQIKTKNSECKKPP
jgi:hypothetical protein